MPRKYRRLKFNDRKLIEQRIKEGCSVIQIADELGVHRDTLYREFDRAGCRQTFAEYTAAAGQNAL